MDYLVQDKRVTTARELRFSPQPSLGIIHARIQSHPLQKLLLGWISRQTPVPSVAFPFQGRDSCLTLSFLQMPPSSPSK